jgi:hypothetical protein
METERNTVPELVYATYHYQCLASEGPVLGNATTCVAQNNCFLRPAEAKDSHGEYLYAVLVKTTPL